MPIANVNLSSGNSAMPKAVLKNGVICPLEPLPPEWADGRELRIEVDDQDDEDQDFDAWYHELQALVAQNDPNDLARVEEAIRIADEQAKALVRLTMLTSDVLCPMIVHRGV